MTIFYQLEETGPNVVHSTSNESQLPKDAQVLTPEDIKKVEERWQQNARDSGQLQEWQIEEIKVIDPNPEMAIQFKEDD